MSSRLPGGRRGSARNEIGAAAVEFALVAPLVIMLLIGTITTGLSYTHALGVTNAVREGARFGAIADATAGTWAEDVRDRVHELQFDDANEETSICAELWRGPAPGTLVTDFCSDGISGPGVDAADFDTYDLPGLATGECAVRVVATRNFTISAPPLMPGIEQKMTRGAVTRYERDSC